MALDRRGFMTGTAALGALAACATPNAGAQTDPMFNQPCVNAVRQWRFSSSPQDVVLTVTVNFTLR